jgi:hypothetical protein
MIAAALMLSAITSVEIEGLEWSIELPDPADLSAQSRISLAAQVRQAIQPEGAAEGQRAEMDRVLERLKRDVNALQELEIRTLNIYKDWACASVRQVRGPGGEWERVRLVADRAHEIMAQDFLGESKLWIGRLGPNAIQALGTAVANLAKERAADRVGRFLGANPVAP